MTTSKENRLNICVLIPCFNHGSLISTVLERLAVYQLPCIIVDDGSDDATKQVLASLVDKYSELSLVTLATNSGKGGALIAGFNKAIKQGYSHCLQVDADNQHNLADIPAFLAKARAYPDALISGQPIYDKSVPKSRFYARYITHCWVWLETLSFSIKDSMCGFRLYPLAPVMVLLKQHTLGQRMDFDIEIMVRLYWLGVDSHFIATKVTYPVGGISHFNLVKDNLSISWMHTKLCLGMIPRIPQLVTRHFSKPKHWSQVIERKGLWGMKLLLGCYRCLGRKVCLALLYPIVGYFWLTGKKQRQASQQYLTQLKKYATEQGVELPTNLNTYRHFLHFAEAALDKLAAWLEKIPAEQFDFPEKHQCLELFKEQAGGLLLVSHLGDIEVCRALAELSYHTTINAFVFTKHAVRFNQLMKELNPRAVINLIEVDEIGMDTAILLEQKLQAGQWVAIVGDRTAVTTHHRDQQNSLVWADFLGKKAPFPKGPFILALLLNYPVYLMFCLKPKDKFQIYFEPFDVPVQVPRKKRQQIVETMVQSYARVLTANCLQSPLDWFNFYDFWQDDSLLKLAKDN